MKKALGYLGLFLLAYALFMVGYLPAGLAYRQAEEALAALDPPIELHELGGTLWSGSAAARLGKRPIRELSWRLRPAALLLGRAELRTEFSHEELDGTAIAGLRLDQTRYLREVDARLPVAVLDPWIKLGPFQPEGYLDVQLDQAEFAAGLPSVLQGRAVWRNAAFGGKQPVRLGDLTLTALTEDGRIRVLLGDGGGPLLAEGLLVIEADGSYEFNGAFASRGSTQDELAQALRMLGKAGADGKVKLSYKGRLPGAPR